MASSLHKEQEILQHFIGCPNIVRCFGGFTSVECERKIFNLFLEYASGGCLLDLMENSGKIPERHLDCGLSEDSSYTDSRTNRNYISNATYIQTGSSKRILPEFRADFTHAQVQRITNNFKTALDKGGFGTVFHSYLDDTQVVVKMLSPSSVQRHKQFHAEVELLLRVNHRNLTALIGYCGDGINMELIYG
ncbi:Serine-threonine/tyrosine-protein kinase [Theobroma cacao]|nr:Serine-threonine/tyrosine-protein kinase [Theobroma cacao]